MLGAGLSACREHDSTVGPTAPDAPAPAAPAPAKSPAPAARFVSQAPAGARLSVAAVDPSASVAATTSPAPAATLPLWESALGANLALDDDECRAVPLGFTFVYYGRAYGTAYVGANGHLTFNFCNGSYSGEVPQGSAAIVAPAAGDWSPVRGEAGNVYLAVLGEAPRRRLVVTWNDVALYGSPTGRRSAFQLQLAEGTNAVQFGYRTMAEVLPPMTAGISSGRGPSSVVAYDGALLALQGAAVCYTPNDSASYAQTRAACAAPAPAAPAAGAGGPYAGVEGSAVAFAAAAPAAGLTYAWSFGDGSPAVVGATASHVYADGGRYTATLTVTDRAGAAATSTAEVVVANAAPAARLSTSAWVDEGTPISVALLDAADPSGPDAAAGFDFAFDCGDGYGPYARAAAAACATDDNGVRLLRARLRDKDGGVAEYEARVSVDNVAPRVAATLAAATVASGEAVALSARFSDPGVRDAHWRFAADWGAGAPAVGATDSQGAPIVASGRYLRAGSYTATVSVTDKDGGVGRAGVRVTVVPLAVDVDVRPATLGSVGRGGGRLPVAVLSSAAVDATQLVEGTVRLGRTPVARRGDGAYAAAREDVNGDGRPDLVLHFDRGTLLASGDVTAGTRELRLTGDLVDGRQVAGSDTVR